MVQSGDKVTKVMPVNKNPSAAPSNRRGWTIIRWRRWCHKGEWGSK